MSLKEILYNIKILNKYEYMDDLFNTIQMKSLLWQMRIKFKHDENIQDLFQSVIKEFIIKNYEYTNEFTEEKFIIYLKNALPNRLNRKLNQWRFQANTISFDFLDNLLDNGADISTNEIVKEDFSDLETDKMDLNNALKTLTERQMQVISMIFYEGYNEIEISNMLKISQQRVNKIKKQSINKLKKYLTRGC